MSKSTIEWTELTWNPTTGCSKISQGCKFCYAEIMSNRLFAMGQKKYRNKFKFTIHPIELKRPYGWKKPSLVFVNSMSDLFHADMPLEFLQKIFRVMNENPHLIFQVLTKRADRLAELSEHLTWTDNIWMGVSIEDNRVIQRLPLLKKCGAKTKFLSLEPLIGPLPEMNLKGIHWVIVGGESGRSNPREMKEEWVVDIKDQCRSQGVPFFFKQWGGTNKKESGRLLDGREYNEMPKIFKSK
ncbi:MAG: phage Gp37/Gp68 family protein [Bacteroidetes bacterium]|nr:phage Gp37/Gp68 family protein [Bacteroidota bacterium]